MELPLEITVRELRRRQSGGERIAVVDIREPFETAICALAGAEWMPMNTVPERLAELAALAGRELVVVVCHHGVRSLNTVYWLREQGIANCQSLAGGIDRWSREIDPEVPRY
jgi:rhodanese-related sulfurtransferase